MDGMVEIITGRELRRRWSIEDKLRLVAETREPGARVRSVAVRHGVYESLLFTWRRQVDEGVLVAPEMAVFMPVQMLELATASAGLSRPEPRRECQEFRVWGKLGRKESSDAPPQTTCHSGCPS